MPIKLIIGLIFSILIISIIFYLLDTGYYSKLIPFDIFTKKRMRESRERQNIKQRKLWMLEGESIRAKLEAYFKINNHYPEINDNKFLFWHTISANSVFKNTISEITMRNRRFEICKDTERHHELKWIYEPIGNPPIHFRIYRCDFNSQLSIDIISDFGLVKGYDTFGSLFLSPPLSPEDVRGVINHWTDDRKNIAKGLIKKLTTTIELWWKYGQFSQPTATAYLWRGYVYEAFDDCISANKDYSKFDELMELNHYRLEGSDAYEPSSYSCGKNTPSHRHLTQKKLIRHEFLIKNREHIRLDNDL